MELMWVFIIGISVVFCFVGYFAYKFSSELDQVNKKISDIESEHKILKEQKTTFIPNDTLKFDSDNSDYSSIERPSIRSPKTYYNSSEIESIARSLVN